MKSKIFLLVFVFCLMFSSISSAVSVEKIPDNHLPLPVAPDGYKYIESFFVRTGSNTSYLRYFCSNEPLNISNNSFSTYNSISFSFDKNVVVYNYFKGTGSWELKSSKEYEPNYILTYSNLAHIYDSSFDIYDHNGNLIFEVPKEKTELYQTILNASSSELTIQNNKLLATIKILVICGVGLLALFLSVNLIRKIIK